MLEGELERIVREDGLQYVLEDFAGCLRSCGLLEGV